jgi:hypothetical protein
LGIFTPHNLKLLTPYKLGRMPEFIGRHRSHYIDHHLGYGMLKLHTTSMQAYATIGVGTLSPILEISLDG